MRQLQLLILMAGKVCTTSCHTITGNDYNADRILVRRGYKVRLVCRLQHLESSQDAISSEVDHIKALGSNIEGWKHQMNDTGAQAAAVLALVQSDGSKIR